MTAYDIEMAEMLDSLYEKDNVVVEYDLLDLGNAVYVKNLMRVVTLPPMTDDQVDHLNMVNSWNTPVDMTQVIGGPGSRRNLIATESEDAPVERARGTIKDLKDGKLPTSVVRDLGDAVKQATRDTGVGNAIGNMRVGGSVQR